jgi:hypothetical protein
LGAIAAAQQRLQSAAGSRPCKRHAKMTKFTDGRNMKIDFREFLLRSLIAIFIILVFFSWIFFTEPTYPQMADECAASCKEKSKLWKLVKRDGPNSSKPLAQKFDYACV